MNISDYIAKLEQQQAKSIAAISSSSSSSDITSPPATAGNEGDQSPHTTTVPANTSSNIDSLVENAIQSAMTSIDTPTPNSSPTVTGSTSTATIATSSANFGNSLNLWVPLFSQMKQLASDNRFEVRRGATETLFKTLTIHGSQLNSTIWAQCIWKVTRIQ